MTYGFVKVGCAIPTVRVADVAHNLGEIEQLIDRAEAEGVQVVVFPELCLTAYTCQDLFLHDTLLNAAQKALEQLLAFSKGRHIIALVGLPLRHRGLLLNVAAVVQGGKLLGIVPKTFIPNYKEFYEKRWFHTGADVKNETMTLCAQDTRIGTHLLFSTPSFTFGVELCEDLWAPIPPSSHLALQGADVIFNLSASNELIGKQTYLKALVAQQSARCLAGYVYSSAGYGESTQDVVFAGNAMICENGSLLAQSQHFQYKPQLISSEIDIEFLRNERRTNTTFADSIDSTDEKYEVIATADVEVPSIHVLARPVNAHPFIPTTSERDKVCHDIIMTQVCGLAKRVEHTHTPTLVIGVSGGLDSTLALLIAVETFDYLGLSRKGIHGITMPGFGTTDRTYHNAVALIENLGLTLSEINIRDACIQHFKDIHHNIEQHDVTYENGQARERTQILMDVANQCNGLVVGTGDLSELALGWATYNGDHMSMYNVNASIPKTLVRYLVDWIARHRADDQERAILKDILSTPISPELLPKATNGTIAQKTEEIVGPYELHDFFLYNLQRMGFGPAKIYFLAQQAFAEKYDKETLKKWLMVFCRRFFAQQFKRSCLPDGPKVGSCSLSPRGDWRMASDTCATLWIEECKLL